jgi:transcriptional regulator with XRE-family HTH domain
MSSALSVEQLSRELMRVLRGAASQRAYSRALGFTSNVAYSWETGRRFPEASVFLRAAGRAVAGFDAALPGVLSLARAPGGARLSTPRGVQQLVLELARETPRVELARNLGVDRTTLSRWLAGSTEPRLPELLRLVQVGTQRLLAFVALIADPQKLSSTRAAFADLRLQEKLAYELPWSHAVLRALELQRYTSAPAHSAQVLASAVGISARSVAAHLSVLERAGQIVWTGSHFESARVMAVDTRSDPVKNLELKRHWARVGLTRIGARQTSADALFSFNLFATSEEAFQRIRQLHLDYYDRVRAIVDETQGTDRVVLMNLQLVPLEQPAELPPAAAPRAGVLRDKPRRPARKRS